MSYITLSFRTKKKKNGTLQKSETAFIIFKKVRILAA